MTKTNKIGILGGGQLARMLALAGHPLGMDFITLDPAPDACANAVTWQVVGAYDDRAKLEEFAGLADIITYEFENIPPQGVEYLAEEKVPVYPPPLALAVSRDRLKEKTLFRELGIPVPKFFAVDNPRDLKSAVDSVGFPAVLKTRTMGYDGKGQVVIKSPGDMDKALELANSAECILEGFISFTREISIVAVRGRGGEIIYYPVNQNTHKDGILHYTVCTANDPMQKLAEDYVTRLLNHFDYVGVIALELFDAGGTLIANEIAPRVHNTGHWSIEGAKTSQFENHIRAIAGLPLGDTEAVSPNAMVNFIGSIPPASEVLAIKGAHYHNYGKAAKPGRKLGHATICGTREEVESGLKKLLALI